MGFLFIITLVEDKRDDFTGLQNTRCSHLSIDDLHGHSEPTTVSMDRHSTRDGISLHKRYYNSTDNCIARQAVSEAESYRDNRKEASKKK